MFKRLDIYLLKNFVGLFFATFFIAIFILLMQFMWMHVNDLVGKGIGISVLGEFFLYATASVVPLALPLAVLLASIITFGNLSEQFELTAMKAAGISLFRIFRPLAIVLAFLSVGAFFFSDRVLPVTQGKLWALIFSLRQKSPELDIPEGEFYDGIEGFNLYVGHKNKKTGMLYDLMVYDYSQGFQNATVTRADSAQLYFTEGTPYLIFELHHGESFENLKQEQQRSTHSQRAIPYRREMFSNKRLLMDFSSELQRMDASMLGDQHVSKNVIELKESIDSVAELAAIRGSEQSRELISSHYFNRERVADQQTQAPEVFEAGIYDIEMLYNTLSADQQATVLTVTRDKASLMRDNVEYNCLMMDDYLRYIRRHEIEMHRKFTLAFACLIFFFIGAPLGAIIRKGGLGAPVVISVVMFIIYYIIDNTGYKMAREALWPVWQGMWLSSGVLLPIGIFLTYKAATDSALFNPEAWWIRIQKTKQWIQSKKH